MRKGQSSLGWMCAAVAPWCLGVGVVVSFTANAGQDASMGASFAPPVSRQPAIPLDIIPEVTAAMARLVNGNLGGGRFVIASLTGAGQVEAPFAEVEDDAPRLAYMTYVRLTGSGSRAQPKSPLPEIDRTHRTDPFVPLRPSLDSRLRDGAAFAALRRNTLLFASNGLSGDGDSGLASVFLPTLGVTAGPESVAEFEAWPDGESPVTKATRADASPPSGANALTGAALIPVRDGSTPLVRRAAALGSTTPVALASTPIEIVERSRQLPQAQIATTIVRRAPHPDYAVLLSPTRRASEKRCLAEAVYFEARSESEEGQAAVAQVVLNRVRSGLYPATVCGVVYQNRQRHNACQFSFACDGSSLRVSEPGPWAVAVRISAAVTNGTTYNRAVGNATHYHANYVRPTWARQLKKMDVIGHHIFYRLRSG